MVISWWSHGDFMVISWWFNMFNEISHGIIIADSWPTWYGWKLRYKMDQSGSSQRESVIGPDSDTTFGQTHIQLGIKTWKWMEMDPNGIRLYVPLRIGIVHRWSRILFDYYGNILLDSCRLRLFAQWNVSAKISSVCVECLYMSLRLPWKLLETRGMGEPFLAGTTSKLSGVRRNLVGKCWKAYIWYSSRFIFLDYTIWQTIWAWIPYTCIIIYTIWCTWFYREIKAQRKIPKWEACAFDSNLFIRDRSKTTCLSWSHVILKNMLLPFGTLNEIIMV